MIKKTKRSYDEPELSVTDILRDNELDILPELLGEGYYIIEKISIDKDVLMVCDGREYFSNVTLTYAPLKTFTSKPFDNGVFKAFEKPDILKKDLEIKVKTKRDHSYFYDVEVREALEI
ncbi:MAG: hypothetical protein HZB68_02505 [Candidatus Aenigmarchaeota archaeon]|nr:hypothetical protein [Candidatus Aenigmarchaeota archaeon]